MFLLDSNVWITFLRNPVSPVVARLRGEHPTEIRVCSVVVAELLYGCLRSAKPIDNRTMVDQLLAPFVCLPIDEVAADLFATTRRQLERQGSAIGPFDLQIAAIALANDCTLVTNNTAEFSRVPDLNIEDWQQP